MEPVLLPVPDTCRALGVGKTKLYDLLKSGDLKSITIGRKRLICASSIRALAGEVAADGK
jgi:excisionase family DNA binding protein